MEILTNKIYARKNDKGIVTKLFSSVFEQPTGADILIEEGNDEYHAHVHLKYTVADINGKYNYKYDNGLVELTEDEKENLFPTVKVESETDLINKLILGNLKMQTQIDKLIQNNL